MLNYYIYTNCMSCITLDQYTNMYFQLFSSKSFIYQQMHFISVLGNLKIYIKIYIKSPTTCFGLRPPSGSLHMSLAEVTFIKLVKLRRYVLCGCVAACYIKSMLVCVCCVLCMLPHNRIVHNDVILPI